MGSRVNRLTSRKHFWICVVPGVVALGGLVVFVLLPVSVGLWQVLNSQVPSLPNLTGCTRVEIEYGPSTFEFFFTGSDARALLSPEEVQYLQSLDPIVLNDPESIAAIAHEIALASDPRPLFRPGASNRFIQVTCYRNAERLSSFVTRDGRIVETESGVEFQCRLDRALRPLAPQQLRPFRKRVACAHTLSSLRRSFYILPGKGKTYPQPSEWCDVFLQAMRDYKGMNPQRSPRREESMKKRFVCPNMQDSQCRYAINPNCEPNSPPETVLLFETKAGWNQHGGPELFSFDNHDPRGGCVLFNDRTFRFIRTEAELHALRWK